MPPLWPGFSTILVRRASRACGDAAAATATRFAAGVSLGVDFAAVVTSAAAVAVEIGLGGATTEPAVIATRPAPSRTTKARPPRPNMPVTTNARAGADWAEPVFHCRLRHDFRLGPAPLWRGHFLRIAGWASLTPVDRCAREVAGRSQKRPPQADPVVGSRGVNEQRAPDRPSLPGSAQS